MAKVVDSDDVFECKPIFSLLPFLFFFISFGSNCPK